jgi:hypothetical protein
VVILHHRGLVQDRVVASVARGQEVRVVVDQEGISPIFANQMHQRKILKLPSEEPKVSSPFSIRARIQRQTDFVVTKISQQKKRKTKISKIFARLWLIRQARKWSSETLSL